MPNPLHDKLLTLDEERVARLYQNTFNTDEGQLILEDLRNRCFCKTTPFTGKDSETNFNTGMQAVYLHIINQVKYEPKDKEKESEE